MTTSYNIKVNRKISRLKTVDVFIKIQVFNLMHCESKEKKLMKINKREKNKKEYKTLIFKENIKKQVKIYNLIEKHLAYMIHNESKEKVDIDKEEKKNEKRV